MVRLIVAEDPTGFRSRAEPFLQAHEAENNLLFGILHGIEREQYEEHYLASLEQRGSVVAVAIKTAPYNVVISLTSRTNARLLAETIEVPVPGVIGEAGCALAFSEARVRLVGGTFRREMAQRIYALTMVRDPPPVPGRARFAEQGDRDVLLKWLEEFDREALPDEGPRVRAADQIDRYVAGR